MKNPDYIVFDGLPMGMRLGFYAPDSEGNEVWIPAPTVAADAEFELEPDDAP
jgi:hypothetical protein